MIDFDVLRHFGTTNELLREVFTCDKDSPHKKARKRIEDLAESRIHEALRWSLRAYPMFYAADLAWDGPVVTKELLPLMQYAQGKINFEKLKPFIKELSPDMRRKVCKTNSKNEITGINLPDFLHVSVNLVKSLLTRRRAALVQRVLGTYPFMKYDSYSRSYVAQLRADVLTQRVEQISTAYNYPHDFSQRTLECLMYGHTIEFPNCAWEQVPQFRKKKLPEGQQTEDHKFDIKRVLEREGIPFVAPHPTRSMLDPAHPPHTVNTDTGVEWTNFWDIVTYRDVEHNTAFWNRNKIFYTENYASTLSAGRDYFNIYYPDGCAPFPTDYNHSLALENDRKHGVGIYNADCRDNSLLIAKHRMKVIPSEWGLGQYPAPVWLSLTVGGTGTILHAEWLPSTPAIYYQINSHDGRRFNAGFAHEALPWQDEMNNLLNQILMVQNTSLLMLIGVNSDKVDEKTIDGLRKMVARKELSVPQLYTFSAAMQAETGVGGQPIEISSAQGTVQINALFQSLIQLMALAERALNTSPQELGQSQPRETSAMEISVLSDVQNALIEFFSQGLDDGNSAKKKLVYESFMALGSNEIFVPVVNRYENATIEAAGFRVVNEAEEGESPVNVSDTRQLTIVGTKDLLEYNYTYTNRDAVERINNPRSAEVLVQALAQLNNLGLTERLGQEQLFKLMNAIFRLAGAPVDVIFSLRESDNPDDPIGGAPSDREQIREAFSTVMQQLQAANARTDQIEQLLTTLTGGQPQQAGAMPAEAAPPQPIQQPEMAAPAAM